MTSNLTLDLTLALACTRPRSQVRSALLLPLRMPAVFLSSTLLYLLCVPGFVLLVKAHQPQP